MAAPAEHDDVRRESLGRRMPSTDCRCSKITSASGQCRLSCRRALAARRSKLFATADRTNSGLLNRSGGKATTLRAWLSRGQGNTHAVINAARAEGDPSVATSTRNPLRLPVERRLILSAPPSASRPLASWVQIRVARHVGRRTASACFADQCDELLYEVCQ